MLSLLLPLAYIILGIIMGLSPSPVHSPYVYFLIGTLVYLKPPLHSFYVHLSMLQYRYDYFSHHLISQTLHPLIDDTYTFHLYTIISPTPLTPTQCYAHPPLFVHDPYASLLSVIFLSILSCC